MNTSKIIRLPRDEEAIRRERRLYWWTTCLRNLHRDRLSASGPHAVHGRLRSLGAHQMESVELIEEDGDGTGLQAID